MRVIHVGWILSTTGIVMAFARRTIRARSIRQTTSTETGSVPSSTGARRSPAWNASLAMVLKRAADQRGSTRFPSLARARCRASSGQ